MADARDFPIGAEFTVLDDWIKHLKWVVVSQDPLKVRRVGGSKKIKTVTNTQFWKFAKITSRPPTRDEHVQSLKEKYGV